MTNANANPEAVIVERIERPDPEFFHQHFVSESKPVIITGAMNQWSALSLWTLDYLKAAVGTVMVRVAVSPSGLFPYDAEVEKAGLQVRYEEMKFSDYIDSICSAEAATEKRYLAEQPMPEKFPGLLREIEAPDYFEPQDLKVTNLWLGPRGTISRLHFDLAHNLLAQVRGRKRVVLFAPAQRSCLYPAEMDPKFKRVSQLQLDQPNLDRFPDFVKARPWECVLEAGEILFIPLCWWHQVYALDAAISVNFWWGEPVLSFALTAEQQAQIRQATGKQIAALNLTQDVVGKTKLMKTPH